MTRPGDEGVAADRDLVGGRHFNAPAVQRPTVTIATVIFNGATTFDATLKSVLPQRSAQLEYVVVDGGSTDGTLDVIRSHADSIDCWLSGPDGGIYAAMNKALSLARGDWLLFLGADDELLVRIDDLLSDMIDPGTVYYGDVLLRDSGLRSGGRFSTYRLMQENICHQAILYPRAVYKNKLYDTTCGVLADHKYNLELWGGGTPFTHINRVVSRFHEGGASAKGDSSFEPLKLEVIRASFGWPLYAIKRLRSACIRLIKGRHVSA